MKLIIDTNILISRLLKDSTIRKILLNESLSFYLPEIVLSEVNKYLPYIILQTEWKALINETFIYRSNLFSK